MTSTLPGIQITHRCAAYDGKHLCGDAAPYLVSGTSLCAEHAITYAEFAAKTLNLSTQGPGRAP